MTFEIKNTTLSVDLTRKRNSPLLIIKNDTCTDIEIHICVFEVINIVHVFFPLLFLCANTVEKSTSCFIRQNTYPLPLNFESLPALRVTVHVTVLKFIGYYTSNQTLRGVSCVHTGSALFESQLKAVASTNGGA